MTAYTPDNGHWFKSVRLYADQLIVAIDSNQRIPALLRRTACGLIEQAMRMLKGHSS